MKKLYTLALAAAVAFGATAATHTIHKTLSPLPVKTANTIKLEKAGKAESTGINFKASAVRKAVAAETAYSQYIWSYYTPLSGGADEEGKTFELFSVEGESYVYADGFEFPVQVDLDAATITISMVALDEVEIGGGKTAIPVVTPAAVLEDGSYEFVEDPVVINITDEGLSMSEEAGFGIVAVDAEGKALGYFGLHFLNQWVRYIESDHWTTLGDATYTDGIIYSMYVGEGEQPVVTGILQRSVEDPGYMRLKNAWRDSYGLTNPLLFDMTDPEFVLVPYQFTGLEDNRDGYTFIISQTYNLCGGEEPYMTKEDFLANEELTPYLISVTDNTLNIPGNAVLFNWPYSSDEATAGKLYMANDAKASTLVMPGDWNALDNITVEGADAPVEYFNLQGVRVQNPSNGLYIRRHGKNTTKVLVK